MILWLSYLILEKTTLKREKEYETIWPSKGSNEEGFHIEAPRDEEGHSKRFWFGKLKLALGAG